ncbi:sentrin-specific protease 6 isoform X3 [Perognathus longimembris pacificus]|uniref:sentrin-specific protease 6 isoform X3 n=2 Tax=Perognathus longimembris pacificus TaxID=214514 RepID=UPI002018B4EC|nr:sentrin-specific protease 6 isoform X3 [Perognathus longimembris pacificus]
MAAGKSGSGGGGGGGGGSCSAEEMTFLEALARAETKKDGGFKNNWSFDHEEGSEGDTDKDGAHLLSVEEDSETSNGEKLNRPSEFVDNSGDYILKTYVKRNKAESFKTLKGNPIGLNMLSNNKKLSENTQNASLCSGTVVHGRRFHHAHVQIPVVKTAAQRKEYPPHVQKAEINAIRISRPVSVESIMKKTEESESQVEPEIKRKAQQKRHCSVYQPSSPLPPASKKCLTHLEVSEQRECCPKCGKEKENQTKCQSCGIIFHNDLQRNCRQAVTLNDSTAALLRTSIHQNSGQKLQNTGLTTKKFYGSNMEKIPVDIIVNCDDNRHHYLHTNGKVILPGPKITKATNLKERKTSLSDLNDPIILSSDDDDDSDRTKRRESISPRPADSACSSPAPSTGKVEAAFNANPCRAEHELRSTPAESEPNAVVLPRKARMKDQFGNSLISTPLKRRKLISQEALINPVSLSCHNTFESVILNCRSIRVGTLFRLLIEPVIFSLNLIKIHLDGPESDPVEIILNTSDLTKCEWCNVRKLPVVFLQAVPAIYQKLSMQLQMSKEDKVWNDCKGINKLASLEEQYIILIFQNALDPHANMVFESIITDIGLKNNVSNFFAKIPFEEANSRLVACTRSYEESIKGSCTQKESKVKTVSFESKVQARNKQEFQFFDDEEETGENHTIFIGPIEKLIVYPPPPAKGGISVTNEDLHCLSEGEFLNDVIIDFYLKYLVLEKLKKEDAERIHIFSSFFYKRLNQRERRNHETSNLSIQQKRHGRVKTWTRHVDIFEKDFIFVPLNEAAHWFLAVVCFPGLEKPKYEPNPHYRESATIHKSSPVDDSCVSSPLTSEMDSGSQNSPAKPVIKKMLNKKHCLAGTDSSAGHGESEPCYRRNIGSVKCTVKKKNHTPSESEDANKGEAASQKVVDRSQSENGLQDECLSSGHHPALARAETKKDGGFKNNWSFDHEEGSEGDTDKDGAHLLSVEEDSETSNGEKLNRPSEFVDNSGDYILKTYVKRNKAESFKTLKGNPIGLNMLSNNKKLSENTQNASLCSGTVVHGRRFHHAHVQIPVVKTAAQSNQDRKERKEYPPHVQKAEINAIRISRPVSVESIMKKTEESESQVEPEIKRKAQQKRHCSVYQPSSPLPPASKKCLTHLEVSEQRECCPKCGKEKENQTKCQSCGIIFHNDLQRNCRQAVTLNDSTAALLRTSIHQNSGQKLQNTGLTTKKFYGSNMEKIPVDIIVNCDDNRHHYLHTNGKVILPGPKITKATNLKERKTSLSDLNDPIILSSDDDDDSDRTKRRESISPRPADSACSSPAPSTGKVEAAFNANPCRAEHELRSTPAESEPNAVVLPRKARMKDQFGNSLISTPLKRRKLISQEALINPVSLSCHNTFESVILNCRSIRVGTLFRLLIEPVIFSLNLIKIHLDGPESDPVEIILNTSDLTKCEWCNVRKLPVVFLQAVPAIYQKLSMQLQMSKEDKVWNDCKGISKLASLEEQYIILIFQNALDPHANMVFESIITDIGLKNNVSNFFAKIPFEEANSRLVACTRSYEESIKGSCTQKESKVKTVSFESKVQARNKQEFQFFDDEEETGENHTIFIGPIEKLIVYPPPPAKGGISVTNEDLHCLSEGEFLNDVIIDFYLKYLVLEKLKKEDAERIHIFSSFFYKRLNQRERRNHETSNLSIQQKRHGRVKTWTRHVDIFEKDFIFVPLNEAAHWFLAVVCFPGLEKPKYEPNPHYRESATIHKSSPVDDSCVSSPLTSEMDSGSQNSPAKPVIKKMLNKKHCLAGTDSSAGHGESEPCYRRNIGSVKCTVKKKNHTPSESEDANKGEAASQKVVDRSQSENGLQDECLSSGHHPDGLSKIRLNYGDQSAEGAKMLEDGLIDFSEDQDNQDDSSDDGFLADDNCNSEIGQWHLKPTLCKQPCILLMDSLRGPSRSNVVKILREYLEVEWEVKKGSKRSFSKDVMKGSNPKVPQQNNFSDCGVYILQYVESFFENPILNFELPMNLLNWFPPPRMRTKREEIRNIILKLQEAQCKEKQQQHKDTGSEAAPGEGAGPCVGGAPH